MDKPPLANDGVAEPIASLMADAGVSLNGLAAATLIPYTTLRLRLHEPERLTMGDLLRIAEALGVAPDQVLPRPFAADAVA